MADEPRDLNEVPEKPGFLRRITEGLAARQGLVSVEKPDYDLMEAKVEDRRVLKRELDLIAWQALDYAGGNEQDLKAVQRRRLVQQSRVAWQQDPQIGAATSLMADFALGRGVPKPKARDEKVQEVLDDFWDDEDNQLVLTSYAAQLQLVTDLMLQANLFFLAFDEGKDGKVKLAMLDHDCVETVVRDPENRRRILWYVTKKKIIRWDFNTDTARVDPVYTRDSDKVVYYPHWENEAPDNYSPDAKKIGKGRVYHVAINRTGEMAFGHPLMHRVLRWATAFNSMMEARVDAAKAAAAFMMKRKVKGTPNQLEKIATQALSRRSEVDRYRDTEDADFRPGPKGGSIINENEALEHEPFNLSSGGAEAEKDGQMIRSQISGATGFPQHYLGDIGSANLATATSMELPVLKRVESFQEVIEQIFRWGFDMAIEKAIEQGRLTEALDEAEWAKKSAELKREDEHAEHEAMPKTPFGAPIAPGQAQNGNGATGPTGMPPNGMPPQPVEPALPPPSTELGVPDEETAFLEALEEDEARERDLNYDFGLPSPLRRLLTDLTTSVSTIARTFDPNGTNIELSRTLLAIIVGEGLEMADPSEIVEKVYPAGYQDPALAALKAQQAQNPFGMQMPPNGNGDNPYGSPQPTTPEANPYGLTEAAVGRLKGLGLSDEDLDRWQGVDGAGWRSREDALALNEAMLDRLGPEARQRVEDRARRVGMNFDQAMDAIRQLLEGGTT